MVRELQEAPAQGQGVDDVQAPAGLLVLAGRGRGVRVLRGAVVDLDGEDAGPVEPEVDVDLGAPAVPDGVRHQLGDDQFEIGGVLDRDAEGADLGHGPGPHARDFPRGGRDRPGDSGEEGDVC